MSEETFEIKASENWSDDLWFVDQNKRELITNDGHLVINEGKAGGTILGANLCTFNLLQGTEYFPNLTDSVLFLEDDGMSNAVTFDRDLQSLIHLSDFKSVKGLVIGRVQKSSKITSDLLIKIIRTKKELDNLPVVANVDFGHTDPKITFPVGGEAKIDGDRIEIVKH